MRFLFSKLSLLGMVIYVVLYINGVLVGPKDFWSVVAILVPVGLIIQIEEYTNND